MKILITGGAGYIGSITAMECIKAKYEVVVFDHFVSHKPSKLGDIRYVEGDLSDAVTLEKVFVTEKPDVVMHFAAYIQMGESVANPRKYYDNNLLGSRNLVECMLRSNVNKLVFASSAGVYGNPVHIPIPENDPKEPENPYGETKLAFERLLRWYDHAYGLKSISIRFFNAAGASDVLGEDHHDESHIIPNVINAQLADKEFTLFGNDYPTPDGTCVRDYIHVLDLAQAFILSAEALVKGADTTAYNAGTGTGYSNKQIIEMVEKVSGKPVKVKFIPRRPGDAGELVADVTRIKAELKWSPTHSDLETIIKSAYDYHSKKWYSELMNDSFTHTQLQQLEQVVEKVLNRKLGDDYMDRIERIENNTDSACKISKDTNEELTVTQAKVDDHEERITILESNFATA